MHSLERWLYEKRNILARRWHDGLSALVEPIERTQAIAAQKRFCGTYVAITGSSGKTTTAMLTGAMLGKSGRTAAGVTLNTRRWTLRTLRRLRRPTDYVVQEVSAHNGPGGIASLLEGVRIDVAVVTSVGHEHWAAYHDLNAIALEKSWLTTQASNLSCLNADDPLVRAMAAKAVGRVLLFGTAPDADVRAENVTAKWPGRLSFDLVIGSKRRRVTTRFAGTIMLTNVLAAIAVVHGLGANLDAAVAVIADLQPIYQHGSVHEVAGGHTYLLDTVKAPIWNTEKFLAGLPELGARPLVLVLGQLSDKAGGGNSKTRRVLKQACAVADEVIALGDTGDQVARIFDKGEPPANLRAMRNVLEVADYLRTLPPALVVLKSGHASRLARIHLAAERNVTCTRVDCSLNVRCRDCALLSVPEA